MPTLKHRQHHWGQVVRIAACVRPGFGLGLGFVFGFGLGFGIETLDWHMSNELFVSQYAVNLVLVIHLCEIVYSHFFTTHNNCCPHTLHTTYNTTQQLACHHLRRVFYCKCLGESMLFLFSLFFVFFLLSCLLSHSCWLKNANSVLSA